MGAHTIVLLCKDHDITRLAAAQHTGGGMSKLLEFMHNLSRDAVLADEYARQPVAVMMRAGLSAEERKATLTQDYEAIKTLSGLKDGQFATQQIIFAYDD